MTFKEFMKEVGYNLMTTFWEDFSIADKYGIAGVKQRRWKFYFYFKYTWEIFNIFLCESCSGSRS